jgi:hypothetical protein
VIVSYSTPNEQCFSYIIARTSYIWWDNDIRFILDQHAVCG